MSLESRHSALLCLLAREMKDPHGHAAQVKEIQEFVRTIVELFLAGFVDDHKDNPKLWRVSNASRMAPRKLESMSIPCRFSELFLLSGENQSSNKQADQSPRLVLPFSIL